MPPGTVMGSSLPVRWQVIQLQNLILLPAFLDHLWYLLSHLDSPEADAKVKSGARGVSPGIFTCEAEEGMSRIGQTDWPNCESAPTSPGQPGDNPRDEYCPFRVGCGGWASFCLAQYIPDIRWGSARDADPGEPAAGDCCQHC